MPVHQRLMLEFYRLQKLAHQRGLLRDKYRYRVLPEPPEPPGSAFLTDPRRRRCTANTHEPVCHRVFPFPQEPHYRALYSDPHQHPPYGNCTPREANLPAPTARCTTCGGSGNSVTNTPRSRAHPGRTQRDTTKFGSTTVGEKDRLDAGRPPITPKREN